MIIPIKTTCAVATLLLCISNSVFGLDNSCAGLPGNKELHDALQKVVLEGSADNRSNGGFNLHMWATVVNRDGFVCAVAYSGNDRYSQWPGSRVISAQKAYTANAFSLDGLALSTANLYAATQPGGSLYALEDSNPVAASIAYASNPSHYGTAKDPMVGKKMGGIIAFGGGLGLYAEEKIIGALGVSGDTSCADHNVAWKTRDLLGLDNGITGVNESPEKGDNIIFDLSNPWGHPTCLENEPNTGSQAVNDAVLEAAPLN